MKRLLTVLSPVVFIFFAACEVGNVTSKPVADDTGKTSETSVTTGGAAVKKALQVGSNSISIPAGITFKNDSEMVWSDGNKTPGKPSFRIEDTRIVIYNPGTKNFATLQKGHTKVWLDEDGFIVCFDVDVTDAIPVSVAMDRNSITSPAGPFDSVHYTATFSDGTTKDIGASSTWSSSDNAVVTVAGGGNLHFVGVGNAVVTAYYGAFSKAVNIIVTPAILSYMRISLKSKLDPALIGLPVEFDAIGVYTDNKEINVTSSADWSLADPENGIAEYMSPGKFRPLREGDLVAVAKLNDISAKASIKVSGDSATNLTSADVNGTAGSVAPFPVVTVTFGNGYSEDVTKLVSFISGDETKVQVTKNGLYLKDGGKTPMRAIFYPTGLEVKFNVIADGKIVDVDGTLVGPVLPVESVGPPVEVEAAVEAVPATVDTVDAIALPKAGK